ncbi:MAG: carbon-nitrogen hydrolase family protein [Perlucidibaca sp.]
MQAVRVAALQMCSGDQWSLNQAVVAAGLRQAGEQGVELLVLPENFALFGAEAAREGAARWPEITDWLAEQARLNGLWLVAGTLPAPVRPDGLPVPDGRVRSATLVFSAEGRCVGRYDKRHLFDVEVSDAQGSYRESATFEPGDELPLIATPWGGLGVLTCYDLRFPEQARALRSLGADLLVCPAAFTAVTGEAHWQVLLRARAIENQCLMIAAGQGGQHSPARRTWGHSQVIDAWGQVLAERQESGSGLVCADWDRGGQADLRRRMPVQAHRCDLQA